MEWSGAPAQSPAEVEACVSKLDPAAPADYRRLAALLADDWSRHRPRRVGLAGGQGAGKSTLGRLIEAACAHSGLRAAILSLDDFYRTRDERCALAARVHPLFETRGPPGTHDVDRLCATIDALLVPGGIAVPRFDKGLDDRVGETRLEGPFDLVILEGWCVGAEPASREALVEPINALEEEADPEGVWRGHVNDRLAGEYAALWGMLDEIVFLRVPDLEAVRRWRLEQESVLPAERRKTAAEVARFVEYYERITRSMLERMPAKADWLVELGPDHGVVAVERRGK